jgi:hypothetical protein
MLEQSAALPNFVKGPKMPYFQSASGSLHYLSDEDIANGGMSLLPDGSIQITDDEAYVIQNPPPTLAQVLAAQSAKLQGFVQLANAQKIALAERISTLNDAIEMEMATSQEEEELVLRTLQQKQWKAYAVLLGRVTGQAGWPLEALWPVQPAAGMDLSVSVTAPQAS